MKIYAVSIYTKHYSEGQWGFEQQYLTYHTTRQKADELLQELNGAYDTWKEDGKPKDPEKRIWRNGRESVDLDNYLKCASTVVSIDVRLD